MPTLIVMTQWQMLTFQNVFQNVIRQKKQNLLIPQFITASSYQPVILAEIFILGQCLFFKALSADTDDVTMLSCMMHR